MLEILDKGSLCESVFPHLNGASYLPTNRG